MSNTRIHTVPAAFASFVEAALATAVQSAKRMAADPAYPAHMKEGTEPVMFAVLYPAQVSDAVVEESLVTRVMRRAG